MSNGRYKSDMSIDERVMMGIIRVAEHFKKEASALFKKYGLTFPQYNVLRVLDASKEGRNTIKDVKKIMLVSGANLTGITQRLEKLEFITRTNAPEDDRIKYMQLTDKGKLALKQISDENEELNNKYLRAYSNSDKSDILSTLRDILSLMR